MIAGQFTGQAAIRQLEHLAQQRATKGFDQALALYGGVACLGRKRFDKHVFQMALQDDFIHAFQQRLQFTIFAVAVNRGQILIKFRLNRYHVGASFVLELVIQFAHITYAFQNYRTLFLSICEKNTPYIFS